YFNTFTSYFCHMWDREAKMNLMAIQEAEFELDQIFEDEDVSEEMLQEAREIYHQIEESKVYYRKLERVVASVRSQEIFNFIPQKPDNGSCFMKLSIDVNSCSSAIFYLNFC